MTTWEPHILLIAIIRLKGVKQDSHSSDGVCWYCWKCGLRQQASICFYMGLRELWERISLPEEIERCISWHADFNIKSSAKYNSSKTCRNLFDRSVVRVHYATSSLNWPRFLQGPLTLKITHRKCNLFSENLQNSAQFKGWNHISLCGLELIHHLSRLLSHPKTYIRKGVCRLLAALVFEAVEST